MAWLAAGIAAVAGFVAVEARSPVAMAPLSLFRSRDFSGVNLLTFCLYFALGSSSFFLPFELIRVHGYSASGAGASLLPLSLMMGGLSQAAGRLGDRIGPRIPLIMGPVIVAIGLLLLARAAPDDNYWTGFFPATIVLAIGLTITVAPLTTVAMSSAGDDRAGTASGINIAVARIAALIAVATLSLAFMARFDQALAGAADGIAPADLPPAGSGLAVVPGDAPGMLRAAEVAALNAAFVRVMMVAAALALFGAAVSIVTISGSRRPRAAALAAD